MTPITTTLLFAVVSVVLLNQRNKLRIKANKAMLSAIDDMDEKWNILLDAKAAYDSDVPDDLLDMGKFMVDIARTPFIEFIFAKSISSPIKSGAKRPTESVSAMRNMRDPLPDVFLEFLGSWIKFVSNKNILARFFIRQNLGRLVESKKNPIAPSLIRALKARGIDNACHSFAKTA